MTDDTEQAAEQTWRNEDRREAPRYSCSLRTEIRLGDDLVAGSVSNLSVVGARVDIETALDDEAELEVCLFLSGQQGGADDDEMISVVGTVVWTLETDGGYMSGLRFEIMGPHELERLRRFLRTLDAPKAT